VRHTILRKRENSVESVRLGFRRRHSADDRAYLDETIQQNGIRAAVEEQRLGLWKADRQGSMRSTRERAGRDIQTRQ